ncbi:MAG TPA: hypothetical protein PLL48_14775 [Novosphingobium sp.]|nr:hypothetical protein [Novosphingobium sp.]
MIAVKSMRYGGRNLEPGDEFDAMSARDARILRAIGKARDAEADVDAEAPAAGGDDGKKRTYRRKDMKAED